MESPFVGRVLMHLCPLPNLKKMESFMCYCVLCSSGMKIELKAKLQMLGCWISTRLAR